MRTETKVAGASTLGGLGLDRAVWALQHFGVVFQPWQKDFAATAVLVVLITSGLIWAHLVWDECRKRAWGKPMGILMILAAIGLAGWGIYTLRNPREVTPPAISPAPASASIPITVTTSSGLRTQVYAGFKPYEPKASRDSDSSVIDMGPIYITNTSTDRPLTLDIKLLVISKEGSRLEILGDGLDFMGRLIGRDDDYSRNEPVTKRNNITYPFLYSPLKLARQETKYGRFVFVFKVPVEMDDPPVMQIVTPGNGYQMLWKITDVATGATITFDPNKGYPPK